MNDNKLDKWAALSGVAFVVVAVVGAFLAGSPPKVSAPDAKIISFTKDNQDSLRIAAYLAGLGIILFLVFLGELWSRLRRAEGGSGRLAGTAAMGGIVAIAIGGAANGIGAYGALHPLESAGTFRLSTVLFGFLGFAALVLTEATSIVILRTKFLAPWLGWFGLVVAFLWLVGSAAVSTEDDTIFVIGFVAFLAWALWLIALGVMLFRTTETSAPASA
jgi:hypothetical protein